MDSVLNFVINVAYYSVVTVIFCVGAANLFLIIFHYVSPKYINWLKKRAFKAEVAYIKAAFKLQIADADWKKGRISDREALIALAEFRKADREALIALAEFRNAESEFYDYKDKCL